jgi:diguanylate cyclase (GGDEF)-like protein
MAIPQARFRGTRRRSGTGPDLPGRVTAALRPVLVTSLLAGVALAIGAASLRFAASKDREAAVMALAQPQAALVQQVASLARELARPPDHLGGPAAAAELSQHLFRLSEAHAALTGDEALVPARRSPELAALYFAGPAALDTRLRAFLANAARLPTPDAPLQGQRAAISALLAEAAPLRALLEDAARLHQAAERQASAAARLLLGLAILLGLGGMVVVLALVLGPVERRLAAMRREIEAVSASDPLTGLMNRGAFAAAVGRHIAAAPAEGRLAVVAVDLDWFKETNEAQGQEAGDAVLCAVAERLRRATRDGDAVGRLGGDEFAVAVHGLPDEAAAEALAQRLRAALHEPVAHQGRMLRVGATLGLALADAGGVGPASAEQLLRAADAALGRAKRTDRGSVARFSAEDEVRASREAAILRALDAWPPPGIHAALQPQIRLSDGSLAGFEALARWEHPVLGRIGPVEFLPLAERAGSLPRLGSAVRAAAFATFRQLRGGALPGAQPVRIAVNVSAAELAVAGFARSLEREMTDAGLAPDSVEIEITEEVLLDRVSDSTRDRLAALRGRGARLALDDFGTGYSGLNQLLRLPLDAIKLDRCFVRGLGIDRRAEEIVRATIALAHGLGLEVIAEGVETEEQLERLREVGCDMVQGFLLARPMVPAELTAWLREREAAPQGRVIPLRRSVAAT